MSDIKISDVLHLAADKFLWDGRGNHLGRTQRYSCVAVYDAIESIDMEPIISEIFWDMIIYGLQNLGLDPISFGDFDEFKTEKEQQGARYAWLKFAAMIAEEQGV